MYIIFFIIGTLSYALSAQTLSNADVMEHPSVEEQIFEQLGALTLLELVPLTREEIIERLEQDLNIHVRSNDTDLFDRYFLSYIYNYFQTMKSNTSSRESYNLRSLGQSSQRLVSVRGGNDLYFAKNAGEATITRRFKELMDYMSNQTYSVLPDEIRMTFEYNNELYAQLNEAVLSSEDIKGFMYRHSGIVLHSDSDDTKPFSRIELLMVFKQYLELPVHIRDNLALKRILRVKSEFSLFHIFSKIFGTYNNSTQTITLTDAAFEQDGTDDKGEDTILHEIGHALWAKSIWQGLSQEAKEDYARLSWQGDEAINDEFISDHSETNVSEDFASHFSAYIHDGEILKYEIEAKYNWLKEHIFLNVEYITDVVDNLKIFVESEDGDIFPPYFVGFPYESIIITVGVDNAEAVDYLNGVADIKVEVSGLFDNKSKIKKIDILLQSEDDHFWIHSPAGFDFCDETDPDKTPKDCVLIDPSKPGWYAYNSSQRLALNYFGGYKIAQIKLEDEAGNKKTLRSNLGDAVIPFPGTRHIVEEEQRKRKAAVMAAKRKREAEAEEARRKMEVEKQAERVRQEHAKEEARRETAAEEMAGLNILSLYKEPITLYQDDEKLATLEFGECVSITQEELLGLEVRTGWFDWFNNSVICSNVGFFQDKCDVRATTLIRQNQDEELFLGDYRYEFEADFSQCNPSKGHIEKEAEKERAEKKAKQKREFEEEKIRRKQAAEEMTGFSILSLSEFPVRLYQGDGELTITTLDFGECISITKEELSLLGLEVRTGWFDWFNNSVICSNVGFFQEKCDVRTTTLIRQNQDKEPVLGDYRYEFEADFSQCIYSQAKKEEEAEKARLIKIAKEAVGLNIVNLSNRPIKVYQDQEEVLDLEPKKCISINESELLALTLKKVNIQSDAGDFICTNVENSLNIYKCDVTATSLVKQNEDGEYILTDYKEGDLADFSYCRPLTIGETPIEEETVSSSDSKEDKTPPYFVNTPSDSISVSVEKYDEYDAFIKVEANGVFDDMSQIEDIDILLQSDTDYFWLQSPTRLCDLTQKNLYDSHCLFIEPDKPGNYTYYKKIRLDRHHPGDYRVRKVELGDTSVNNKVIDFYGHFIYFPGKRLLVTRSTVRQMNDDLEIRTSKTVDGDTLIHVLTTDMRSFNLYDLYIGIMDMETGQELQYKIDTNRLSSLNDQFESQKVSNKMSLPIIIPKELTKGKYRLNWIGFETKETRKPYYYATFDDSDPDTYFNHISDEEDTIAQPVVDDIVMDVIRGANRRGGDTSIKISIPIEGLDEGDGEVEVIVRTPTGDKLSFSSSLRHNPHDGSRHIDALVHLGSRHAEGEYMITHISTMENYASVFNNSINHEGLRLHSGGRRVHNARLLERGIRATLRVTPPPPKSEKY